MKTLRHSIILLTLITCLMGFGNMVQARVYWSPAKGVDTNDGQSGRPVKTWPRALELLSTQDDDEWIYLNDEFTVSTTTTMDGTISGHANARIKRNNGNGSGGVYMIRVNSGATLTLKNILIDGKRDSSTPYANDTRTMIVGSGNIVLDNGAILRDNWVKDESEPHGGAVRLWSGGTLTMNAGSLISNCRVYKDGSTATFRGGAIMSGASCQVTINGGTIENCYSMGWGGAISLAGGTYTFNMSGGTITGCHAGTYGGAIHIADDGGNHATATVNITGGVIDNCYTQATGGGIFVSCTNTSNVVFSGGEVKNCRAANGGGIYIKGGATSLTLSGGSVNYCSATANGGGIYAVSLNQFKITGTSKIDHCSADTQTATNDGRGGGIIVDQCDLEIDGQGVEVSYNHARCYGGGVQIGGGKLYLKNGKIHHNTGGIKRGETNGDTGHAYGAAGIHVSEAEFYMTGGELYANVASTLGGGLHASSTGSPSIISITKGKIYDNIAYKQGGGLHINTNTTIEFTANSDVEMYGNKACVGGAILLDGGSLILRAGNFHDNQALNTGDYANNNFAAADQGCGGAFGLITENTSNSAVASFTLNGNVTVTNNTASNKGGAAYLKAPGVPALASGYNTISLSQGTMNGNHAGNGGGALYVNRGNITINGGEICNNTAGANGGGIYFDAASSMTVGNGDMNIKGNTANGIPNNVYLLSGKTIAVASGADFRPVYFGVYTANRTPNIPVFTGSETQLQNIYDGMVAVPATRNVVDDSQCFSPYLPSPKTILYFGSSPWSPLQQTVRRSTDLVDADGDGYYDIGSVKQLTAFLWHVNGITTHDASFTPAVPSAKGKLTADFSMDGHYWVPFANYTGTFDGAGYIITDLTMVPTNVSAERGLFGINASGTIKNVNLRDCFFAGGGSYIGSIVSQMNGGTLCNSIAQCEIEAIASTTKAGGLVGHVNGGTVHSSIASCKMIGYTMGGIAGKVTTGTVHSSAAMPDMTGYTMGGLVGYNSSNVYNSFAHAKFHSSGSGYVGGLVAVNTGTVENCYAREQSDSSHGSSFGWLAGANQVTENNSTTKGNLNYCYAPDNTYTASGVGGNQTGLSTFTPTSTPYQYKHADNQVVEVSGNSYITNGVLDRNGLKGLLATLNEWVDNGHGSYASWMRTSASPINDDYPIHNYTDYVCVGSSDNIGLEYSTDFNDKFEDYINANIGTIYLYQSPTAAVTSTLSNSSGVPALYIHEDVAMMHASAIKAHVGITLDNSAGAGGATPSFGGSDAIDWHFFSSALADAPIGLVYGDESQYLAYHYPDWQAYFSDEDGYFPTNFNTSASSAGDYYADWDLYAYFERCYHWINLKRNSASHWLEDWPGVNIPYENENIFKPGKGYMVALKDEGYLQGYGTLNTNSGENEDFLYVPVTYTPEIAWTTREGHNLLGNPYQSYLDFNKFATDAQNATLWNAGRDPLYIIIDEGKQGYVIYTVRQSKNTEQASRYLHPHQGFMIDVDKNGSARFCNAMRTTTLEGSWTGDFRDDSQPDYPLVNLMATDGYGNRDIVTVELGRPDKGGALKQDAWRTGKGSLWCRYEDEDYALVFTQPGLEYANIRFSCDEDGEYTMTWNTQNGEFSYLHLIDNMTGTDIDCLSKSEYKFSARTTDYNSRFRLMFGYTGIEEPEAPELVEGPTCFAFIMNGELVVNGTGLMQLIDLNGRMLTSYNINDAQSTVALPDIPAGLYVLRLITENGTRTQKIILD